ncbi:MAG: hypothetical protein KAU50_04735 [Candidatus Marinimicrobia bacterium]|nr:hypothetical protein [Candidatus Neomarinimicrobiota bacterium]
MNTENIDQSAGGEKKENALLAYWHSLPLGTATLILDWAVIIAVFILIAVIYIPKGIWAEERAFRDESRRRMMIIQSAQDFYYTMSRNYTTDGEFLFKLVSQTHDTLVGDTTFVGEQVVHVDGLPYALDIPEGFGTVMDTTFSIGRLVREEVLDTIYTATLWDDERAEFDTVFINGARGLKRIQSDERYRAVLDTTYGNHTEVMTDYAWNRYRLEPELLRNPVTADPFRLSIDSTGEVLTISSPELESYSKRRVLFFHIEAKNFGSIVKDEPTWSNN